MFMWKDGSPHPTFSKRSDGLPLRDVPEAGGRAHVLHKWS